MVPVLKEFGLEESDSVKVQTLNKYQMELSIKSLHRLQTTTVKTQAFVPQMITAQLSQKNFHVNERKSAMAYVRE